ncbi:MAG: AI-2E family transporter [Rikenellaceae bacterium]|nr:AI-2E family transporter [Rikenellaceae bacterium]
MNSVPKYIIGLVTMLAIGLGVWYFSDIVLYIIVAVVINIVMSPLMNQLCKLHIKKYQMPRWLAAAVTLIVFCVVFGGVFFSLIPLLFKKLNELSKIDIKTLADYIDEPLTNLQHFLIDKLGMDADFSLTESLLTAFKEILNIGTINSLLSGTVSMVGNTAIALFSIIFISFFFIKEEGLFRTIVLTITPRKYEQNINRAIDSIQHLLKRYFTGILLESTIMFTFVSVVLLLFGMPTTDAFTIGTFVGVLNVIPYIGPLIGWCLGVTIGLITPIAGMTTMGMLFIVGGTIMTAQVVDNFVLQPVLYSNSVHAHPLEIFLVILIAGSVGGVLGMLFAIPSYNVIRVLAKEFFNNIRVVQKLTEKM